MDAFGLLSVSNIKRKVWIEHHLDSITEDQVQSVLGGVERQKIEKELRQLLKANEELARVYLTELEGNGRRPRRTRAVHDRGHCRCCLSPS